MFDRSPLGSLTAASSYSLLPSVHRPPILEMLEHLSLVYSGAVKAGLDVQYHDNVPL